MYGDFSRNPFSNTPHITRVIFNQGQPLVEADLNEALNAVIENLRHTGDFEITGAYCNDAKSLTLFAGTIRSPIGGFEFNCPIQFELNEEPSDLITLKLSEHPLSIAHLSSRLVDDRLVHASEIWGMRIKAVSDGEISTVLPHTQCKVSCEPRNAAGLPKNSIIRIEVHSVSADGNYTFKLDTHNAGYANSICKISDETVTLGKNSCFVRPIKENELLEIQEPTPDHFISYTDDCNRSLHTIKEILDRKITLFNSPAIPPFVPGLQCRFWTEKAELASKSPNDASFTFKESGITVTFSAFPAEIKPGMMWLVDSDALIAAANALPSGNSVCVSSMYPEGIRSFGIKLQQCVQAAHVATNDRGPIESQFLCKTAPNQSSLLNWHDLPCGALAVDANSAAMRRWLASMTLGELAGLDHEQVRARLTRDCNIRLEADPALESEILKLIARRDQYLGSAYSQLA